MDKTQICIDSYALTKNLKVTEKETGIPWQTVYWHLKKAGVSVVGDKSRYGSDSDRLAALAEDEFIKLVPFSVNNNLIRFQSHIDFSVGKVGVDVKASRLHKSNKASDKTRWSFSVKKQELSADFMVLFGYEDDQYTLFLIPNEMVRHYQTISISPHKKGKWHDYEISKDGLTEFFMQVMETEAA
jgi:hypothetical protein